MRAAWLSSLLLLAAAGVEAHSASDAYLTLTVDPPAPGGTAPLTAHGQWDIALRDLDFVLGLDDDGDGRVTWRELKRHQAAIERYAYPGLAVRGGAANRCAIKPTRQLVDGHADGAYAALFFEVRCARPARSLTIDYTMFFAVDPSHRGIFVLQSGQNVSTAVLSPEHATIEVAL